MIINTLAWIIFGAITGWTVAQILTPRQVNQTKIDILLGAASSLATGLIMWSLAHGTLAGFNVTVLIVSILGAVVVLATFRTNLNV